jgi:magnesium-transporting ATPase (P-type)
LQGEQTTLGDEIAKMQKDAEMHAAEDAQKKELVEAKNIAEQLVYTSEKSLKDAGDKVPADARVVLLKTTSFSVDEGSLTGESMTVSKSIDPVRLESGICDKSNMLFGGTGVTSGACYAVVTGTGMNTEMTHLLVITAEFKYSLCHYIDIDVRRYRRDLRPLVVCRHYCAY